MAVALMAQWGVKGLTRDGRPNAAGRDGKSRLAAEDADGEDGAALFNETG